MTRYDRIRKEARAYAEHERGHKLGRFAKHGDTATAYCRKCGYWVQITARPQPNMSEIGGNAISGPCQHTDPVRRAPSLKRLRAAFPTVAVDRLMTARAVMQGTVTPEYAMWQCASYNGRPLDGDAAERRMYAINRLLHGYGVEVLRDHRRGQHSAGYVCYVNFGDTYDMTVLYDPETDRYWLGTWGDYVERADPRGRFFA